MPENSSSSEPLATDWLAQDEHALIDKDTYYFAVEEFRCGERSMLFLHLMVHHWTPTVFKEILRNWKLFRECVTCPVFAVGGVEDTEKWERFVKRLGFQFHMDIVCENGAHRRLFIHSVNKNKNEPSFSTDNFKLGDVKLDRLVPDEPVERPAAVS